MRYRLVVVAMVLAMVGVFVPLPVLAAPILISDVDDLQDMDLDLTADYELDNNIDASATSGWNGGAGFEPVGDASTPFTGTFDGQGYEITDLYINRPTESYIGLFGCVEGASGDYVTISDVDLVVDFSGKNAMGGLVGYVDGFTSISRCRIWGSVDGVDSSSNTIGGLAGYCGADYTSEYITISECFVIGDAQVTGGSAGQVGGLIGRVDKATAVTRCYSSGTVSAHQTVGGLVGTQPYGTITDSFSRADVTVTDNAGPGSGQSSGGFVGVSGGFGGTQTNCYSTGLVSCLDTDGCVTIGGYAGQATSSCSDCFWDTETSEWATSDCGTGKTTSEMTTQSTFTNAGWDFSTIWEMKAYVNDGYPYLQWWYDPTPFATWDQILWFEPIDIISGTTLPDRAGTVQNGVITWGANPAGIAIDMGPLVSEGQPPIVATPETPVTPVPDMTGESGQPGWTATQPTLPDNPFYPLVEMVGAQMNIPIWLVWVIAALIILLLIMMVSFKYAPHQIITALAGGGWSAFMYSMGIFPFWVMFIFAAMALAVIIGERTPTVS